MKLFKGTLVSAFLLATFWASAELPVLDKDFACTDSAKASQYVQDFNIDLKSFGGMELCDSTVDTKKLFNDLSLVEDGQFQDGSTNVFILNKVDRGNYLEFLKARTHGIRRANDNPTATAYNSGGFFTMQDGWTNLSTLGRVGTVVHEARHSDGYGHRVCTHGPYYKTNSMACDTSVQVGGAHAVEMEYYSRVALQGTNFHPAYQSMARLMNIARANFVFNQDPMAQTDSLAVLTTDKLIQLKVGKQIQIPLFSKPETTDRLKRTSAGVSMVRANSDVYALDLADLSPSMPIPDTYSYYKMLNTNFPERVVAADMEEFDLGLKRYFLALSTNGIIYSYVYGNGTWRDNQPRDKVTGFATRDPKGSPGIFALLENGLYCAFDTAQLECSGTPAIWPKDAKKFVSFEGRLLKLSGDAVLDATTGIPLDTLNGIKVMDVVEAPTYNVFEL